MSGKAQALNEPLFDGKGKYKYAPEDLAAVCNLDNHHKEGAEDFPDRIISSRMIIEDMSGIEGIISALHTDSRTGIEPSSLKERQEIYGMNSFPPPKIKSLFELIMENFEDPINNVLCVAAVVSLAIGILKDGIEEGWIEGTSIMIALVIIITVNSGNNYMSERRLADLVNLSSLQEIAVFRGSTDSITIDSRDLVVGDLIAFEQGMKIPADCILVEGQDVCCSETELTGEPDGLDKTPVTIDNYNQGTTCTLLAKSLAQTGSGKAIVMAVGLKTVAGVITEKTQAGNQATHLQEKLETIATKIGNVGIFVAVLTFVSMLFRCGLEMLGYLPCDCSNIFNCVEEEGCIPLSFELSLENRFWTLLLETVIIAITVVVVAIPEGLPLAVTISLSFSSKQMQKLNNLVRKLASAETMGGATHICTDKTGTLTENKMTVMAVMSRSEVYLAGPTASLNFVKKVKESTEESGAFDLLKDGVMFNSSARIEKNDGSDPLVKDEFLTKGNVTEQGIIKFFMNDMGGQACMDYKRQLVTEGEGVELLASVPFTSTRKRGTAVVKLESGEVRIFTKGAPDMVLELCDQVVGQEGVCSIDDEIDVPAELLKEGEEPIAESYTHIYERTIKHFADQAYRTILVCYRDMSLDEFEELKANNNDFQEDVDRECLEQNLTAIGVFGLQDPLRDTIKNSIALCRSAGITTIMCTGDNIDTAIAISKNAGIITEAECEGQFSCMTGKNFREAVGGIKKSVDANGNDKDLVANMNAFKKIKKQLKVLARSSPEDKYLLCTGIQESGGVVAMTGDGTNDAPALTKADVGFSMGITGTDVAKGASDIILLDDNFSSIVVALRYGRSVYDNVRKFLQFQLTVNVVAMFIVFFGSVIIRDSPLNAVQMLWVNLIMDTFAALALATEAPAHDILTRMPYHKDAPIVTDVMWRNVFGHSIYQALVLVFIIFYGNKGSLVQDYEIKCLAFDANGVSCIKYNPFFSENLYYSEDDIKMWTDLQEKGELTVDSFDSELYNKFICSHSEKVESGEQSSAECEADEEYISSHQILPSDVPKGSYTQKLIHFTYVFQIFVFMQIFNQINARKIELGEMNVFAGFFNNGLFLFITLFTLAVQMAMVEYGGKTVKCYPLNMNQNLYCLVFGAFEIVVGVVIKFVPLKYFQIISLDDKPMDEEEKTKTLTSTFKKSATLRRQASKN